jgi:hypothetical protein
LRIEVTSAGLELTEGLRVEARRRVLLAVSRFGPGIRGVTIRLTEAENALGGVDRRCRLRARLRSGPLLQAEAVNGELEEAMGRSADRLARLVGVALDGGGGAPGPAPAARDPRPDESRRTPRLVVPPPSTSEPAAQSGRKGAPEGNP